jgi:hypothetical protein
MAEEPILVNCFPRCTLGLEVNTIEGGFMVYQPDKKRVHYLNHTAILILELCNGRNSIVHIAKLVQNTYSLADTPESEVE